MTAADIQTLKPKLTIDEQIEHLKAKGVTFERCTESEAAAYLTDVNYYFRVTAYRTLFEKRVGGDHDGEYVGLDFADLIDLDDLDRGLRNFMFPITIAIERSFKTKIMDMATTKENEDGYSIIGDYLSTRTPDTLARRMNEFSRLKENEYSRTIASKYGDAIPIWLYLEFSSFGAFIDLYRFCSLRWSDEKLFDEHYLLRRCQALRNAAAHDLPVINGFNKRNGHVNINDAVAEAVAQAGISKRVRTPKLKNPRLQSIVTALYVYTHLMKDIGDDGYLRKSVIQWMRQVRSLLSVQMNNDAIQSSFGFLLHVFQKWL